MIRIGTMGHVDKGDILTDLLHLEEVIRSFGSTVTQGTGVNGGASNLL